MVVAAALAVALGAWAGASHAATQRAFRVADIGSRLRFATTICTRHAATVRLIAYVNDDLDQYLRRYPNVVERQPSGCHSHSVVESDESRYDEGSYYGHLTAILNGNVFLYSRHRRFFIAH